MLCLIPMAWISFTFLDLTGSITGGLITNLNVALGSFSGPLGAVIGIIGGAFIGLILIFLFPIHWCIFYRPDDVILIISVILPWILCCTITSAISAHSPRGGIHTSLAIGIGYVIPALVIYFILPFISPIIAGVVDGLASGLTDLPYALAVGTSILEGSLVGAVFGGFIGSLKYKPEGGGGKAPKVKKSKPKDVSSEPTLGGTGKEVPFCTNCGSKLTSDDTFCTNCGQKF